MLFISCTVLEMFLWRWLAKKELASSIGFSRLINTQNSWLHQNYKNNIRPCVKLFNYFYDSNIWFFFHWKCL
jgi:hypothetical protein